MTLKMLERRTVPLVRRTALLVRRLESAGCGRRVVVMEWGM